MISNFMNCKKERKLFKSKMKAENKFRSVSLPPTTQPLETKTPLGHSPKKHHEEIYKAEEKLLIAKETYQNHIKNCPICN